MMLNNWPPGSLGLSPTNRGYTRTSRPRTNSMNALGGVTSPSALRKSIHAIKGQQLLLPQSGMIQAPRNVPPLQPSPNLCQ